MVKKIEQSDKLKLNKKDLLKILKGAGITLGGSLTAYLLTILPQIDFGPQTLIIVSISSIILNALLKVFKGK